MIKHSLTWYELHPHFQILSIGYLQNICTLYPAREDVPYWILVLLDKGQRTFVANQQEFRISAHEFFLLPPHTKQMPLELDEHTACYVHFLADGREIPVPEAVNASALLLPMKGRLPDDLDCFMILRYVYEHSISPYADPGFIITQLHAILSVISLHCQKHTCQVVREEEFIDACLRFIREHAGRSVCALDYEKTLGLSYHQINQKFKKTFGYTVKQYHKRLRMHYAAELIQSGIPLQQVAEQCGYEDYYFFTSSFKKEYGITPSMFRILHGM